MTTNQRLTFLIASLFVLLYLMPLSVRPLFIPDETRYAEVPREMIATGDWMVPHLNGLRYFEKPVMGYWLTALSLKVFGENNLAVRLPSALAAGITMLLILLLCSASGASGPFISWLAALIFMTSGGVALIGTFAVLDSVLAMFLTATMEIGEHTSELQSH